MQLEQLEAIQRRAIQIIFKVTFDMPYHSGLSYANISSLQEQWESLSKKCFRNIMNNPYNTLFDLLPSLHEATIIGQLRSPTSYLFRGQVPIDTDH